MADWWRNVDVGVGSGSVEWCAAARTWRGAWAELAAVTAPPPPPPPPPAARMPPPPPPPPRARSPDERRSASPDSTSPGDPLPDGTVQIPIHPPPRPRAPSPGDSEVGSSEVGSTDAPDSSGTPPDSSGSPPESSTGDPPRPNRTPLTAEEAWRCLLEASPPDTVWHSLRNCVAYQAGVWQKLCAAGMPPVSQPAAFRLAIVLRHTRTDIAVRMLAHVLKSHPHARSVTAYILALLTDDEASWCGSCGVGRKGQKKAQAIARSDGDDDDDDINDSDDDDDDSSRSPSPPSPSEDYGAPARDLRLFGDCELAVLAASREEYDAHAKLVRAEYSKLTHNNYVELRIKVLQQFTKIPKLYHSAEFAALEAAARENIAREIATLRDYVQHRCRTD